MKPRLSSLFRSGIAFLCFAACARAESVLMYHYDAASSGVDSAETTLTTSNVSASTFGKLFSVAVDGLVQAEPLYLPAVSVVGGNHAGVHDLIFVATQHDSLYAVDAGNGTIVWQTSFLDQGLSGATVTTVPSSDVNSSDVTPEIGICSTPVIDPTTKMLYVTAKTKQVIGSATPHYVYTLYKVDVANGNATANANIVASTIIGDTISNRSTYSFRTSADPTAAQDPFIANSTASDAITVNGQSRVYFNALRQMNRCGLVISNGVVYIAFASHGDNEPYHGWLLGYSTTNLAPTAVLNLTPNGSEGGIWESGCAPNVDSSGNIFAVTGNGTFDGDNNYSDGDAVALGPVSGLNGSNLPSQGNYGDCVVKIQADGTTSAGSQNVNGWGLKVADYFSPFNQSSLSLSDSDLGSGGSILLPDSAGSTAHPHLMLAAGKQGNLYLIDRDNMGSFSTRDNVVQSQVFQGSFATPSFFNGNLFWGLISSYIRDFPIANGAMSTNPLQGTQYYGWPGTTMSISADGTSNGIIWSINHDNNTLVAYDATNIASMLYTSSANSGRDSLGTAVKFSVPTVADGRVAVGTLNSLVVYGLLSATPAAVPTVTTGLASSLTPTSAVVAGTVNPKGNDSNVSFQYGTTTGYGSSTSAQDEGSGSANVNFTQPISGLSPSTIYHYRAVAANSGGTAYGADKTFKTAALQSVSNSPVVFLSASGAEIEDSVVTDGLTTTVFVRYGTDTSYGSETATLTLRGSASPTNLLTFLPGLTAGGTDDFQIVTHSASGTVTSSNFTVTARPFAPALVAAKAGANPTLNGTTFSSFGNPVVNDNNGNVAFRAVLTAGSGVTAANDTEICADDDSGTLQLVARTGSDDAPGTTAPFSVLNDPVYNDNNAVAFIGTLKIGTGFAPIANDVGVWSNVGGALSLVAQKGVQAPGYPTGVKFAGFTQIALPDVNGAIMLATVTPLASAGVTAADATGIWEADSSNSPHLLVRTGEVVGSGTITALSLLSPVAPVIGQSRSFAPANGTVTFLATFSNRTTGIFDVTSSGAITPVARAGGSAPSPSGATYSTFGPPAVNGNGNNAFRAVLATSSALSINALNNEAIFADDNTDTLQLVARTGTGNAPGTTAPFATLTDPVYNDDNEVAFVGTLQVGTGKATAATKSGVWSNAGGPLSLIAQSGEQAPGCPSGVNFSAFSQIALPDANGVALLATLDANAALGVSAATNTGIWASDGDGNLDLIVRTGDVIGGKTVTALAFLPTDTTVQGQGRSVAAGTGDLTYLVTFSDRSTAIYRLVF